MKNLKLAIVALGFGIAGAAFAQAPSEDAASAAAKLQDNPIIQAVHTHCAADQEKLCAGKTGAAGHQCMIDHDADESPACRDARRKADAFLASLKPAAPSAKPPAGK